MKLYAVSFSLLGIILIIVITAVFFVIVNRLLSNKIEKTATRVIVALTIAVVLTILGITTSIYLRLHR